MTVYVLTPRDAHIGKVIDVTSRAKSVFSPFLLGPVDLYGEYTAKNVENAWQFSKVYPEHDSGGQPSESYFQWAANGWADSWAHRYPMGKGAVPLYSYWDGDKLGYIAARHKIYMPLYATAVERYAYGDFLSLVELSRQSDVTLVDFDAYNHVEAGVSLRDVFKDPNRKAGHGFVLALLIERYLQRKLTTAG